MTDSNRPKNRTLSDPSQWVDLHGNHLYRFALSRLRNPDIAEDIVQETLLAALKAQKNFAGASSERTWLIGILKHKVIDYYRKKYRETPVTDLQANHEEMTIDSFFDHVGHPHDFPRNWLPHPDELLDQKDFWRILEDCVHKLPKHTADAFTLREMEQMTTEEICKILHVTSTNLWVMLHRARLQIRRCLEQNWFEERM